MLRKRTRAPVERMHMEENNQRWQLLEAAMDMVYQVTVCFQTTLDLTVVFGLGVDGA